MTKDSTSQVRVEMGAEPAHFLSIFNYDLNLKSHFMTKDSTSHVRVEMGAEPAHFLSIFNYDLNFLSRKITFYD
jgi:hypothetical protein